MKRIILIIGFISCIFIHSNSYSQNQTARIDSVNKYNTAKIELNKLEQLYCIIYGINWINIIPNKDLIKYTEKVKYLNSIKPKSIKL